jgi:hypothetical protein
MAHEPQIQDIMMVVMQEIMDDRALSFPWYQPWIRSEAEAEAATDRLPLVYSWNEIVSGNQLRFFTVSVNGGQLAEILTRYLPRAHPAFTTTRDTVITLLAKAQNRALVELCSEFSTTPSRLSAQLKN